jgi:hypothetical protein
MGLFKKKCYYGRGHPEATRARVLPGVGKIDLCSRCARSLDQSATENEMRSPGRRKPAGPPKPAGPMGSGYRGPEPPPQRRR